eukprot:TRINITY_DN3641_c2_g1_i1.p1 TRINITY_DN3641_c2_g1~~TRINITY_DN3641_c2_g1_i1.p1  ORF type:complete len:239 (+),score=36.04 TRINITY_DN3641_c2_g1_i1:72-788(+)
MASWGLALVSVCCGLLNALLFLTMLDFHYHSGKHRQPGPGVSDLGVNPMAGAGHTLVQHRSLALRQAMAHLQPGRRPRARCAGREAPRWVGASLRHAERRADPDLLPRGSRLLLARQRGGDPLADPPLRDPAVAFPVRPEHGAPELWVEAWVNVSAAFTAAAGAAAAAACPGRSPPRRLSCLLPPFAPPHGVADEPPAPPPPPPVAWALLACPLRDGRDPVKALASPRDLESTPARAA